MRDGKNIASGAILGLAGVMVVAALFVAGGPGTARKQHRDRDRIADLSQIWWHAQCQAGMDQHQLPAKLSPLAGCGELPRLSDPYTDVAYGYQLLNPRTLRLCAVLDLPRDRAVSGPGSGVAVPDQPGCFDFGLVAEAPRPSEPAPAAPSPDAQQGAAEGVTAP